MELDRIIDYVRSLRKDSGGFGATRRLPATIEDTFHAVSIFKILALNALRPDELATCKADGLLVDYIASLWPGAGLDLKSVCQLLITAHDLEAGFDTGPVREIAAWHCQQYPSLVNFYHAALIMGPACRPMLRKELGNSWHRRLMPARYTCKELMMGLTVIISVGDEFEPDLRSEMTAWFQDCQAPDGGFGFLPGTTSFIENCHFCLRALEMLDASPRDPEAALAFISGCQTGSGGCGRRGKAAPFLDATYHAVAAAAILGRTP